MVKKPPMIPVSIAPAMVPTTPRLMVTSTSEKAATKRRYVWYPTPDC